MKLTMVAPGAAIPRRAGRPICRRELEILDPGLATTDRSRATIRTLRSSNTGQELRPRLVLLEAILVRTPELPRRTRRSVASLLGRRLQLLIRRRATTPGEFVVPPAKAEEMYHPGPSAARARTS
ncbi:MAG: hypothetical protein IPN69_17770 [Acidobacteria bacterium]|nr:hypothetical protein [Acidobacteriota bacterium]